MILEKSIQGRVGECGLEEEPRAIQGQMRKVCRGQAERHRVGLRMGEHGGVQGSNFHSCLVFLFVFLQQNAVFIYFTQK